MISKDEVSNFADPFAQGTRLEEPANVPATPAEAVEKVSKALQTAKPGLINPTSMTALKGLLHAKELTGTKATGICQVK